MIKNILFDFDGVIIDSMPIRDYGFQKIFEKHPKRHIQKLITYHQYNAGLSRFHKIKYFYNNILNKEINDNDINYYADKFSVIMRSKLTNKKYLIKEVVDFIKNNYTNYEMHIVSGSEQNELQFLCKSLNIEKYFNCIYGSPMCKNNLVKNIILANKYISKECVLIGDSINDYDAAKVNNIYFYGINNIELKNISEKYISTVISKAF